MNRLLAKSIIIVVAAVLMALCVGSAFCLYTNSPTPKNVTITAIVPTIDDCHLLGTFTSWSAANSNKMAYAAGTYSFEDVSIEEGGKFKVYNATTDQWINTVDSIATPHSNDGNGNIVMAKAGQYDVYYTAADGITVSADNYTYYFSCPAWTSDGTVVFAWVWGGSDEGSWRELTTVSANNYSLTLDTDYTGCKLVRHWSGTTISTVSWSTQAYGNETNDLSLASSSTIDASSFH